MKISHSSLQAGRVLRDSLSSFSPTSVCGCWGWLMGWCVHMCLHGGQGQPWICSSGCYLPGFLKWPLSFALELTKSARLTGQWALGSVYLYLHNPRITSLQHHTQFFMCVLGTKLKPSCLYSKFFMDSAISLGPSPSSLSNRKRDKRQWGLVKEATWLRLY